MTQNAENQKEKTWDMSDITSFVQEKGERIIIPEGMSIAQAVVALQKYDEETSTEVNIHENIACFPLDGAVAFSRVMQRRFGWTKMETLRTMFGEVKPTMVGVEVAYNKTIQIPWGRMSVPKIKGILATGFGMHNNLPCFVIQGSVQRRDEKLVNQIAQQVREEVRNNSIYRNQAIRLSFRDSDGERIDDFGPQFAPKFIDPDAVNVGEIVYSDFTQRMLKTNLFNLVEYPDRCRKNGIPLKRGILLSGPFGVGKTLTADLLAKKCVDNNWTFIYLDDARDLDITLGMADLYSPCVVFAEDVDKTVGGARDVNMDKLFNTIDGVEGKCREIMVVLTTNSIEKIHPGFLRPGRIDTVVQITAPDDQAVARLVELYGRDSNGAPVVHASQADIIKAMRPVLGANAAFIREVVERSKLSAIDHSHNGLIIKAEDLANAAMTMKPHVDMLYPDRQDPNDPLGMMHETQEIDPLTLAGDILGEKFAEVILSKVTNPRILSKIVVKTAKRAGRGSNDGLN